MDRAELLRHLESHVLRTPLIVDAFRQVDRADFVPPEYGALAYEDTALPIAGGQTISQPYTVAFMFELLQPGPGHNVLDVGAGSGWTTALLSACVGVNGKVYGVEIDPVLVEAGLKNVRTYHFPQASIHQSAPGELGLPAYAPYDRILVSAEAGELPGALLKQLKAGGRLVAPVAGSIVLASKREDGGVDTRQFPGFVFVPLRT